MRSQVELSHFIDELTAQELIEALTLIANRVEATLEQALPFEDEADKALVLKNILFSKQAVLLVQQIIMKYSAEDPA